MGTEHILASLLVRIAGISTLLKRHPFTIPRKILILKPCCLSHVMLATPLLVAISNAFPNAQIDWAIGDWARPAVATNKRLTNLISSGRVGTPDQTRKDFDTLIAQLRKEKYDTVFVPDRSAVLAYVAWRAGIFQRIGINMNGAGLCHTIRIKPESDTQSEAQRYLSLAKACDIPTDDATMEFFPPDTDRMSIIQRLSNRANWLGDSPLVLLHPGGGHNPLWTNDNKRWQLERMVRVGNYLSREKKATLILLGSSSEEKWVAKVAGLMSEPVLNWAGQLTLGEMGALCEVADLFVGNDAGGTQVAAATGCKTIMILGDNNKTLSRPLVDANLIRVLADNDGVLVETVIAAVDELM